MNKMFFLRHYGILLSAKSVLIDTDVAELTYQAYGTTLRTKNSPPSACQY